MNRLSVRLLFTHLLVAVAGASATVLIVRAVTARSFEHRLGRSRGGMGPGSALRDQLTAAVDSALLVGLVTGLIVAAVIGSFAAYRLARPLGDLGAATAHLATGDYAVDIPHPGTRELDDLAEGIRSLGRTLAETEQRRVRLLGEVAHEMRTPLTVVDGYLEGMIDGVLPTDDDSLAVLSAEMRRLRRLADDLSSLSQAEEGSLELTRTETDVVVIIRQAGHRLRPQAEDAGVELVLQLPGSPEPLLVDADRIAQIITNLVGNALRATPPGGTVRVALHPAPDWVVIEVTDTGEGVGAEDLERIFERFYRGAGRRRGDGEGSGIGLTVSRRLAAAHGGTLTASSPGRGAGATFTLTLPRRHDPRGRDGEV